MKMDYEAYQKILPHLTDEFSKYCFFNRMLYSVSGDMYYIYNLLKKMKVDVDSIPEVSREFDKSYHLYDKSDVLSFAVRQLAENRELVIFGCGELGKRCFDLFNSLEGIPVKAFFDNNFEEGQFYKGVPILKPAANEKDTLAVIIAVAGHESEIKSQLANLGYTEEQIYVKGRNWLVTFFKGSYFDNSVFMPRENEIFVDAGAYHGETVIDFCNWCPTYKKVYSFEADKINFEYLQNNLQSHGRNNIELYNLALWDKKEILNFTYSGNTNGTGSLVNQDGNECIEADSLDEILNGEPVTFIKMDIEGAELKALQGAAKTITKYLPRLAICIYHKPEDIYEIPLYILELSPMYQFKIRHYSSYKYDTILYAYVE